MNDFQTLLTEVSGRVATIWLNRPERLNAFSPVMTRELDEAFGLFDADDDVRAIVVTGSGRYFSAGADLERGGETFNRPAGGERAEGRADRLDVSRMRTPVIAAMNGSAVGMGLTFPLGWDVRFAAAEAKYGFVFTRRGLVPEASSTWLLPRLIGVSRAMELLLSGRIFSGVEAAEMGLVSAALPAGDVLGAAQDFARDIAVNTSAVSVAATKALVYAAIEEPNRAAAHEREHQVFRWMGRQADAAEGVTAFLGKRQPEWRLSKLKDYPPAL